MPPLLAASVLLGGVTIGVWYGLDGWLGRALVAQIVSVVGGIAVGGLLAPVSVDLLGLNGTFGAIGVAAIAYCAVLARPRRAHAPTARGLALSTGHGGM